MAPHVNMPSDFPRHHRSTSPDRAEVLMVVLVTITVGRRLRWIAVWLLSDVGVAWLGAVAGLVVAARTEGFGLHRAGSGPSKTPPNGR